MSSSRSQFKTRIGLNLSASHGVVAALDGAELPKDVAGHGLVEGRIPAAIGRSVGSGSVQRGGGERDSALAGTAGVGRLGSLGPFIVMLGALLLAMSLTVGGQREIHGATWTGAPGITETVHQIMLREAQATPDRSTTLRETHKEIEADLERRLNPLAPRVSQWPPSNGSTLAPEQLLSPQSIGVNFRALMASDHMKALRAEYDTHFGDASERARFAYEQVFP